MQVKTCKDCQVEKPWSEFYKATKNGRPLARCIPCYKVRANAHYERNRDRYIKTRREYASRTRPEQLVRSRAFYSSISGRAKTLMKGVERRSKIKGWEIGIDVEFIQSRIEAGFCEVTGLPFDMNKPVGSKKNSYAPSIDRIDSGRPYSRDNSRVVIWQFNMMKAEMSDGELVLLCEIISESLNK